MKRFLLITTAIILCVMFASCAQRQTGDKEPTAETAVNIEELQFKINKLENKLSTYDKIYDDSLLNAIGVYCKNYLSFIDSPSTDQISEVVTVDYLSKLSVTGNKGNNNEYQQATIVDDLFYEKINQNNPNSIKVVALCQQNIVYQNKSTTTDVYYIFSMQYKDKWLISNVEKPGQ